MNLAIYTSNVDGADTGPAIYRENLSRTLLQEQSNDVDITFVHYENNTNDIYQSGNEVIVPNPNLQRLLDRFGYDINWGRQSHIWTEKYLQQNFDFDLFHFQHLPYRRPFWLWKDNTKVISTVHFGIRRFIHPEHYDFFDRERVKFMYKWFSKHLDAIITVTDESKRLHAKYLNFDPKDIYVTHNAPPSNFTPTSNQETIRQYGIDSPYIFHLSNKNYYKNPEGILKGYERAVKEFGISHDLVFGGGRWEEEDVDRFTEGSDIHDRIHFLGYIPRRDLPALYTGATTFFLPSLSEAFPFVLVEAMSCGTPVLTISDFGMPEIAKDAGIYINDPLDVDEIALKISTAIETAPQLREVALSQADSFSWKQTARDTLEIYREVLGKS